MVAKSQYSAETIEDYFAASGLCCSAVPKGTSVTAF
jgi:hypothetical protein